jgi:hypothetical protein
MNNLTYLVLNADIRVIYMGMSDNIPVNCLIRHSVNGAI